MRAAVVRLFAKTAKKAQPLVKPVTPPRAPAPKPEPVKYGNDYTYSTQRSLDLSTTEKRYAKELLHCDELKTN